MSIKIDGAKHFRPVQDVKRSAKSSAADKTGKTPSKDTVAFSAVLQEVSQIRATPATADPARVEKVQALKDQIASGSYQPDLQKVAASLLKFLVEER